VTLTRVSGEHVERALGSVAVNPLFDLKLGLPGEAADPQWRRAVDLCDPRDASLATLVAAVGQRAGARERRVAASLTMMGYGSRLITPAVAVLLRHGLALDLRPEVVWYRYRDRDGFRVGLSAPVAWRVTGPVADEPANAALFERWCAILIDAHLGPFVTALRRTAPVANGLLWGNAASSLAGALRAVASAGPAPVNRCLAAGTVLLDYGPLAGTGTLSARDGQLCFVRRSCCLYYRLAATQFCGDCPLLDEAKGVWRQARTAAAKHA
jgi:ferric iron reductase protein FhuF